MYMAGDAQEYVRIQHNTFHYCTLTRLYDSADQEQR